MNSQTARSPRRPETQRTTRAAKTKAKRYNRQTAHVEARRDGKPLIFGWGSHLSRNAKTQLQRRAVWATTILTALIIVAVVIGFWVNLNIITPGLPITSVNGQQITQSDYRKLVALNAQIEDNKIYGSHGLIVQRDSLQKQVTVQQTTIDTQTKLIDTLNKQLLALPAAQTAQHTNLEVQITDAKNTLSTAQTLHDTLNAQYQQLLQTTIPNEQQLYNQSQVGNDSVDWLQDDTFIRNWLTTQNNAVQAQIQPTASALNQAVASFKTSLPAATSYSAFLSSDNVSDADVHAMMTLILRRQNMQSYLSTQITSPAYQVLARAMTIDTLSKAQGILKQLKSGGDFAALAKKNSVDTSTAPNGGYLGWLARGQYAQNYAANTSASIDNWIFDPKRSINEISSILSENGTFHIIQILSIDPSRVIDATTLQSLKTNALTAWLLEQKAMPGVIITAINQTMLLDTANMPASLPVSAPSQSVPGASSGLPGSSALP